MSAYHPILIGRNGFRAEVEGLLDGGNSTAINDRIEELEQINEVSGRMPTFGAEIEFQFVEDPSFEHGGFPPERCNLYDSVIDELRGDIDKFSEPGRRTYKKGSVLLPSHELGTVMLSHDPYPDDDAEDLIEIRTMPKTALEAIDLYWATIDAIGTVAAREGMMGQVLSTHISAGVVEDGRHFRGARFVMPFTPYHTGSGDLLAATQHNLNALQPLQIDAGLESGISILEAFPAKDASTAIHKQRLEFRHPTVAVIDPRLDILAVLAANNQVADQSVPRAAQRKVREATTMKADGGRLAIPEYLGVFEALTVMDNATGRLVMPAMVERCSVSDNIEDELNLFINTATDGEETEFFRDNAHTFRQIVRSAHRDDSYIDFDSSTKYAGRLRNMFRGIYHLREGITFTVQPDIIFDSPEIHRDRRGNTKKSSTVREVFGSALRVIPAVDEAVARRAELIDKHMVVLED